MVIIEFGVESLLITPVIAIVITRSNSISTVVGVLPASSNCKTPELIAKSDVVNVPDESVTTTFAPAAKSTAEKSITPGNTSFNSVSNAVVELPPVCWIVIRYVTVSPASKLASSTSSAKPLICLITSSSGSTNEIGSASTAAIVCGPVVASVS